MKQWLTDSQGRLADLIYDLGAIKFGAFELKLHEKNPDAPLSPIYITLRTPDQGGPLTPDAIEMIGRELYALVMEKKALFDYVAGIPRAGEPIAEVVSRLSGRPLLKLGKKTEGGSRKIDSIISGEHRPGQLVLLVDDLITQADTKKEAIEVCENAQLLVAGIVVLVDRQQGGTEQIEKAGYKLYAAFPLSVLLDWYVGANKLSQVKREEVMTYILANR
jgi:orotate phosphoribosyltransferase